MGKKRIDVQRPPRTEEEGEAEACGGAHGHVDEESFDGAVHARTRAQFVWWRVGNDVLPTMTLMMLRHHRRSTFSETQFELSITVSCSVSSDHDCEISQTPENILWLSMAEDNKDVQWV